ncbi:MAG: DUF1640 domain-containing protein [Magnetococcales bacterium]|nr:DUF1640 domain-containing protein [Magnetococcales bacterium]
MTTTTFDTLEFVEELKAAGVSEQQAVAQVRILSKATRENLVTQPHLDMRVLELKGDLRETEARLTGQLVLVKWMLALVVAATVFSALKTLPG